MADTTSYGPLALYAGTTGEVLFKDVAYKDLGLQVQILEETTPHFRKQQVSDSYYSMSVADADFNHDGIPAIV